MRLHIGRSMVGASWVLVVLALGGALAGCSPPPAPAPVAAPQPELQTLRRTRTLEGDLAAMVNFSVKRNFVTEVNPISIAASHGTAKFFFAQLSQSIARQQPQAKMRIQSMSQGNDALLECVIRFERGGPPIANRIAAIRFAQSPEGMALVEVTKTGKAGANETRRIPFANQPDEKVRVFYGYTTPAPTVADINRATNLRVVSQVFHGLPCDVMPTQPAFREPPSLAELMRGQGEEGGTEMGM